ncbi:glycosyltransferase family 2 protein [Candidatus Venteria ishoeyi]|uniref:glycosyltransferase family 2 protein n=1 Tax=Candidatus Venteria ishoeyi TaxID=1899563 RepID=UPI0025A63443|nr:glycosyltransferase family 2 protein [Candidatus Venteria ishoeyi]MDM8547318.1 glycosyltransferase family 2 protein [Candidatus Venteria ishoeyi]
MQKADVSVIIVNYNAGSTLLNCVQHVLQAQGQAQVFVVDNASEDDSIAILKKAYPNHAQLHIRVQTENLGFAAASNSVLNEIDSDYVLFLNPDCMIQNDTLVRCLSEMEKQPQAGMAGVLVKNTDGSEQRSCRRDIPTPGKALVRVFHLHRLFPNHARWSNFEHTERPLPEKPVFLEGISGAFMLVRSTALEQVGAMDERYFLHCEDLDWFIRFQQAGWKILFIPDISVEHSQGICSQKTPLRISWYKHRGMVRYYQKFFQQAYPRPLLWAVIAAIWVRFALLSVRNVFMR